MSDADRVAPSPGAVLDALPDPVVTMRADGSITGANRRLTEVLGWDVAEITGRSMTDYVHPDDVALALASLETVGDKDSGELMALRARHRDGGWRRLEAHGRLAALDGEEGIVLVLRDLRSRHGLELDGGDTDVLRAVMSSMHAMVALVACGERPTFDPGASCSLTSDCFEPYVCRLERCRSDAAPWHVVPAHRKWYRKLACASLLLETLRGLDLQWPDTDLDVEAERARLRATMD